MYEKIIVFFIYFAVIFWLGYKGYKATTKSSDYMVAGRKMNPFVMAMSYGATFISTSAIIGFGGAAGLFGYSLLWLTVLNVGVGIFIAMVFFGRRTRRMGLVLDSQTFPELLGRRYQSDFIQGFSGLIIFLFIPVYAAAVLIGISRMLEISLGIPYEAALIGMTLILAIYVTTGGMKSVMYTDAFQGSIMMFMMLVLIYFVYSKLGGVVQGHQALTDMAALVPEKLQKGGMFGWTVGPVFKSPLGLTIYTTIVYGVGVGVLAQPQLAVRYMTVNSDKQLNRAVLFGGIFIPLMTGVAFIVGALSNALFYKESGKISIAMAGGDMDKIIPTFIEQMMPNWFAGLFLLGMFAAAMSTLSSQYHAGGTSLGRDVYEVAKKKKASYLSTAKYSQIGVIVTIAATLIWALVLPGSIIAPATAFFFGLCAATFLPMYMLGLYWKGMTKTGALVSMLGGFAFSMFWLLFVHVKESAAIGLCKALTGADSLFAGYAPMSWAWLMQYVDPNVVALPISLVLAVVVSKLSQPMDEGHVSKCWQNF
ncbi:MAG: sodium:solute symporter family protein [Proteobacteria bacterium]|nr:sodium:solute symporter family protein [Pseudomonadota bacterium]